MKQLLAVKTQSNRATLWSGEKYNCVNVIGSGVEVGLINKEWASKEELAEPIIEITVDNTEYRLTRTELTKLLKRNKRFKKH